jgi:hypothetical protein
MDLFGSTSGNRTWNQRQTDRDQQDLAVCAADALRIRASTSHHALSF